MSVALRWRGSLPMWVLWPCLPSSVSIYGTNCPLAKQSSLPSRRGWSLASRSYPAFAVSQFDSPEKTETYEILRHPGGGRKDVFRWAAPGQKPVAELEIYRPGAEFSPSAPAVAEIAARMNPGDGRELEVAGLID